MEEEELADTYQELRRTAADLGLAWLLRELDEATAIGVVEIKPLRQQTRKGLTTYEELTDAERAGPGRRRAEEFLSQRPMSMLEQVDALIEALMRVFVDLEDVADAAVTQLNGLPTATRSDYEPSVASSSPLGFIAADGEPTVVSDMTFVPDEGSSDPQIETAVVRRDYARREEVTTILRELQSRVHT